MLIQQLANFQNIAPGATGTLIVPPGPTYDALGIRAAGAAATLAFMANWRFEINGKLVQQYLDAADLDAVNSYHGRDAAPGATPFDLYLPFRRTEVQAAGNLSTIDAERLTALRTGDLGPMTLKIDFNAGYTQASAANVQAFAVIKPGAPEPSGLLTFTRRFSYNLNAGLNAINDIPRIGRVICMHVVKSDVTLVTVKRNRVAVWDNALKTAIQDIEDQDGRVPIAGRTVIDFCCTGNLDESLDIRQSTGCTEFEVDLTSTAGGATDILVEYLGTLGEF